MASKTQQSSRCLVSIIIPIHNGSSWIDQCFRSILRQTAIGAIPFEICVCNDASKDDTRDILASWKRTFQRYETNFKIFENTDRDPRGVGYAKNRAVSLSNGDYLCFQDIDDVMLPSRISEQYEKALELPNNTLIGCRFDRVPIGSTCRYTGWANNLTQEQLNVQIYTANGPTIVMPTWFCHKTVYHNVGGFDEGGKGTPEDLLFFYEHLRTKGNLYRIDNVLLQYTYHPNGATFSIDKNTIWNIRMERIQDAVIARWNSFTIWNAGKQGRKFYKSLSDVNREKVAAFCDVDAKKIAKKYVPFDARTRQSGRPIEIQHFKNAAPPIIVCVKLDMTHGQFEEYLYGMRLQEGTDYIVFS